MTPDDYARRVHILLEELRRARVAAGLYTEGGARLFELPRRRCVQPPAGSPELPPDARALYGRVLGALEAGFRRAAGRIEGDGDDCTDGRGGGGGGEGLG